MNSISSASTANEAYLPAVAGAKTPKASDSSASASNPIDSVEWSPEARQMFQMGRITLEERAGMITGDQAAFLRSQMASTQTAIENDKSADGGHLNANDLESIEAQESQTSYQIYSDGHNGAAPPASGASVTLSAARDLSQIGHVTTDLKAGDLTSSQAADLYSQIKSVAQQIASDKQAGSGALTGSEARSINQTQSQLSAEIQNELAGTLAS